MAETEEDIMGSLVGKTITGFEEEPNDVGHMYHIYRIETTGGTVVIVAEDGGYVERR